MLYYGKLSQGEKKKKNELQIKNSKYLLVLISVSGDEHKHTYYVTFMDYLTVLDWFALRPLY